MSEQSIEVVRACFAAYREKGRAGIFDFLAPDVEWEVRSDLPDAETYIGHDGVRALHARFSDVMVDIWVEPQDFILVAEQVVVPLHWGGRGSGSGAAFEEREETWVFTVRDGAITRIKEYGTKEAALEAAALSEHDAHVDSS